MFGVGLPGVPTARSVLAGETVHELLDSGVATVADRSTPRIVLEESSVRQLRQRDVVEFDREPVPFGGRAVSLCYAFDEFLEGRDVAFPGREVLEEVPTAVVGEDAQQPVDRVAIGRGGVRAT